ncbi:MAG: nickel pincer cofactor biosynthesis protein LarC, partial [Eubacteriales bacterium]
EAESSVHGVPVDEIHFHEVGTMDAVADITAVCMLMEQLAPQRVVVSPVHVGSGHVHCAHGILPVPAPATAYILRGIPIYGGAVKGELCTPTGAALLRHFASEFGDMPVMKLSDVGYGMGKKDFDTANCVRAMLGETLDSTDNVRGLCCNLDDMTPEGIGFASERLLEAGALDVYTIPITMKKSRPGVMLCVLCDGSERERIARVMFKYTTTLGVRECEFSRYTLDRTLETVETSAGAIRVKHSSGWGVEREKYEYDDIAAAARERDLSLSDIIKMIENR